MQGSKLLGYRRNYVVSGGFSFQHSDKAAEEPDFDVISEIWFGNMADLREAEKRLEGDFGRILGEEERKLFDMTPKNINSFLTEEYITSDSELGRAARVSV
ncbi:hypothetical protein J2W40_003678 [Sphingobium xenophagum]|uniref:Uncharacterized protein n=1 Tax=Sphingobium xenophagum TaxID=121428 RepID=A0ABU1X6R6_SPHXE|nr:hypothetical protein [Sphingobium xenophagum]